MPRPTKTLLALAMTLGVTLALLTSLQLPAQIAPAATSIAPPAPADTSPAPITPKERITLFNNKDLTGWKIFVGTTATVPNTAPSAPPSATAPKVWSVADNVLKLDTKSAGYVITDAIYTNYKLHVEWRYPKDANPKSNSGVLVHINGPMVIWPACFECQLASGNAGQVVGQGLDIPDAPMQNNRKRAPRLPGVTEKPLGDWNTYDITAKDDTLTLIVNGAPANKVTKLPYHAGHIALQLEGYPIDFQNIYIEPIDK